MPQAGFVQRTVAMMGTPRRGSWERLSGLPRAEWVARAARRDAAASRGVTRTVAASAMFFTAGRCRRVSGPTEGIGLPRGAVFVRVATLARVSSDRYTYWHIQAALAAVFLVPESARRAEGGCSLLPALRGALPGARRAPEQARPLLPVQASLPGRPARAAPGAGRGPTAGLRRAASARTAAAVSSGDWLRHVPGPGPRTQRG